MLLGVGVFSNLVPVACLDFDSHLVLLVEGVVLFLCLSPTCHGNVRGILFRKYVTEWLEFKNRTILERDAMVWRAETQF